MSQQAVLGYGHYGQHHRDALGGGGGGGGGGGPGQGHGQGQGQGHGSSSANASSEPAHMDMDMDCNLKFNMACAGIVDMELDMDLDSLDMALFPHHHNHNNHSHNNNHGLFKSTVHVHNAGCTTQQASPTSTTTTTTSAAAAANNIPHLPELASSLHLGPHHHNHNHNHNHHYLLHKHLQHPSHQPHQQQTPRPFHLLDPQQHQQHHQQQQHHRLPLQLLHHNHLAHHTQLQHPGRLGPSPTTTAVRMAADAAYVLPDDELAQLQKLSGDYQPEVTGPLVGERQSSAAITAEYANADRVYQIKTAALPDKYAYFRTCRGDGQCGWRAIVFTYLEALVREANVAKFDTEEARLMSMVNLFNMADMPYDMVMDFAECAFALMQKLAHALRTGEGNADDILLQTFNDENESMSIITYFKFLASAWVQTHPNDFAGFVPMGDLKAYCSGSIEPTASEVDYVAVAALAAALIKPTGYGFEIMYLDRSPGEEVNVTPFAQTTEQNGMLLPTIRLLYRPGHYDILYKAEDFPVPVQQVPEQGPLHVALANPFHDTFVAAPSNVDLMAMMPGLYSTGLGQRWPSVSYEFDAAPAPQPQIAPIPSYQPAPDVIAPVTTSHQDFVPVHGSPAVQHTPTTHHSMQLEAPPVTVPLQPPPPSANLERAQLSLEQPGPFRPSAYELEHMHALPLQTSIMKNSHYNTAHFLNPDFQPEAWSPEYGSGSSKGKHKSTPQ